MKMLKFGNYFLLATIALISYLLFSFEVFIVVVILSAMILIGSYFLFIDTYLKRYKKEEEANSLIYKAYFSFLDTTKNDSWKKHFSSLSKQTQKLVDESSNDETRLNRLDAYFSYPPFTLMRKILSIETYKRNKDNAFIFLFDLINVYHVESENNNKYKTYQSLLLQTVGNVIIYFGIIFVFLEIYLTLAKEALFLVIFPLLLVLIEINFIISLYFVFGKNSRFLKLKRFVNFFALFFLYVNFETPYNAFILANNELNKNKINDFDTLKSSYQNLDLSPTLSLTKKFPYPFFEEGLILMYRLAIKNDFKQTDVQDAKNLMEHLKKINVDYSFVVNANKLVNFILIILSLYLLISNYLLSFGE